MVEPIKILNSILSLFDVKLTKASVSTRWQMSSALKRLAEVCPEVNTVIDIGAASGSWSAISQKVFPSAFLVAVEPLPDSFAKLQARLRSIPNSHGMRAVVSDVDRSEVEFTISPDRDGSGVGLVGGITQKMSSRTVDSIVDELCMSGPFLIKLDTHGHELPILSGAVKTLSESSAVIIECYNHKLTDQSPLFWELVKIMLGYGFRPFDLVDPSPRPLDSGLWQFDLIFLPSDHYVFANSAYS